MTAAEVFTLLELLGNFLFDYGAHVDLAPLLATHSGFAVLRTMVQDHLDNTVRAVANLGGACGLCITLECSLWSGRDVVPNARSVEAIASQ